MRNISDSDWLNMLVNPKNGIPTLPPEDIQVRFCGRSGLLAMEQAMEFYKVIRDASKKTGKPLDSMGNILDFGCGWGRISRCFLREVPAGRLTGCDCIPEMVGLCSDTITDYRFISNGPMPPSRFENETFDLVYAFSVYSHLSEAAHKAWLQEFYRIMKPGGVLVLTTRPRDFISYWPKLPYIHDIDAEKLLRDYDHGKLVHIPAGGGDTLSASFYGETAIPEAYVRREWSRWFSIMQFMDNIPHLDQKVIIATRV